MYSQLSFLLPLSLAYSTISSFDQCNLGMQVDAGKAKSVKALYVLAANLNNHTEMIYGYDFCSL